MRVDGVLRTEMLALLSVHARRAFLNWNCLLVAFITVRRCCAATDTDEKTVQKRKNLLTAAYMWLWFLPVLGGVVSSGIVFSDHSRNNATEEMAKCVPVSAGATDAGEA